MMAVDNSFHLIGVCYGDCQKIIKHSKEYPYYTKVIIVTKTSFNDKNQYVPITFVKKLADKSSVFCRNGNLISVTGEIVSRETFNQGTGNTVIELNFIANDVMLLRKAFKLRLSNKEFSDYIENFSPDEFERKGRKQ